MSTSSRQHSQSSARERNGHMPPLKASAPARATVARKPPTRAAEINAKATTLTAVQTTMPVAAARPPATVTPPPRLEPQPALQFAPQSATPQPVPPPSANGDFRSVLLAKKDEVMAGMGMKFDAASKMGRVAEDDAVQIAHDEFINLRLNAIGWDQLRLLDEALDRLQTGEFGVCMRCEEPIPAKRLAVVPWAKYCVRCQERISAREHLREDTPAHQAAW